MVGASANVAQLRMALKYLALLCLLLGRNTALKLHPSLATFEVTMSQSKSILLRIPLEVRQDIYSYILPRQIHVWLRDDRLHVSRCLDPDLDKRSSNFPHETDAKPYDGSERAPASVWDLKRNYSEVEWARRARSAWGPHWMCEEWVQLRTTLGPVLLLVCKMMYDS